MRLTHNNKKPPFRLPTEHKQQLKDFLVETPLIRAFHDIKWHTNSKLNVQTCKASYMCVILVNKCSMGVDLTFLKIGNTRPL